MCGVMVERAIGHTHVIWTCLCGQSVSPGNRQVARRGDCGIRPGEVSVWARETKGRASV